ncbi:Senescence-associated protein [Musa troglodytarum]|uniref:Senescence-associated protein n=1 Tax=Musa troglodytarum TaxID=320322 RepID=A0A9E7FNI2_9LILI|nr:Senescence-associated protein [Musa troglodytarum]
MSSSSSSTHPPPSAGNPSAASSYPSTDIKDFAWNPFADIEEDEAEAKNHALLAPVEEAPVEETLICVPGAIVHLIDPNYSIELGAGDFSLVRLRQGDNTLDRSHYFFSLHVPPNFLDEDDGNDLLNYGLTFTSKRQESLLRELDCLLQAYSSFSVQEIAVKAMIEVLNGSVELEVTPAAGMGPNKEMLTERSAAYWTTLAPDVENYSSSAAKLVAKGSGKLIKGILWCGDVTANRIKQGEDTLKGKVTPCSKPAEISKDAIKRMKRAKRITKMSDKVANGVLTGVLKFSGSLTSSVVNSKVGSKLIRFLPAEVILASLDGFGKICDAVEVAGKNVLKTSSEVTTGVVCHRYGDEAGKVTHDSLHAAGHAVGAAWSVFKIRNVLNPASTMSAVTLAKSSAKATADDLRAKKGKHEKKKKKKKDRYIEKRIEGI